MIRYHFCFQRIFISTLVLFTIATVNGQESSVRHVPNVLLVKFDDAFQFTGENPEELRMSILADLGTEFNLIAVKLIGDGCKRLSYKLLFAGPADLDLIASDFQATGFFEYAERDWIMNQHGYKIHASDPFYDNQWGFYNDGSFPLVTCTEDSDIDMNLAWSTEQGSSEVVVAVLDSGINFDHPEFAGRIWFNLADVPDGTDNDGNGFADDMFGWDFVNGDNDPTDDQGHGTAVAGVIAANANNGLGYAGVDWNCQIMIVKTSNELGTLSTSDLVSGVYYAVNNGADVINISAGGPMVSSALEDAVQFAWDNGVIIAASSGNDNGSINYPAAYDVVIAVGATSADDTRAQPFYGSGGSSGSCYGAKLDIVAPGNVIYSLDYADVDEYVNQFSGTSLSCPMVSGVMSLLKAQDTSRTPADIEQRLIETAEDLVGDAEDTPGWDIYFGHGRLNANLALNYESVSLLDQVLGNKDISIYPQPVWSTFTLRVRAEHVGSSWHISSMNGEILRSATISEPLEMIDISGLSCGTYQLFVCSKLGAPACISVIKL